MVAVSNGLYSGPQSERMASSLRDSDFDNFGIGSPYARALLPLLQALGMTNFARNVLESLPHFSDDFDLLELRNVLSILNIDSLLLKTPAHRINPELYPCLYDGRDGQVFILLKKSDEGITYFDCYDGKEKTASLKLNRGECYAFTRLDSTLHHKPHDNKPWTSDLLHRFRGLISHLLMMSFFINFVALIIPLAVMLIYDKVIGSRSEETLPYLLAGVAIVLFVDFGLRQLRAKLLGSIAGRIDYLIGVETFKQLLYMPPLYTERSSVASQLSRLKQFDAVRDFLTGNGASVIMEIPFAVLFIIVIGFIAGQLAWVPIVAILLYIVLGLVIVPLLAKDQSAYGMARANKQRLMLQALNGRMEIKSIGAETLWRERYREACGQNAAAGHRSAATNSIATAAGQLIMSGSALTTIGWGTFLVMKGELTVGGLIAVMAFIWRILMPLQMTYLNAAKTQQIFKSLSQINQLMRINVEQTGTHASSLISNLKGQVTVDRISFRYGADHDPAVLGATFSIKPGELISITGTTGSGKSTLLKLIAGMYQSQAGSILIDDLDIRQLDVTDLRRSMAYVPQEVKMFHGTIAQNLRLNNCLATDDEIRAALQEAGIADDILALPEGINTRIGDNVTEQFPPGLVRGLALARALVHPAPILLLDEPGASMDTESDLRFMNQLKHMRGRYTVIMVTHRPSHIKISDRAILMEKGMVKFVGDPEKVVKYLLGN